MQTWKHLYLFSFNIRYRNRKSYHNQLHMVTHRKDVYDTKLSSVLGNSRRFKSAQFSLENIGLLLVMVAKMPCDSIAIYDFSKVFQT